MKAMSYNLSGKALDWAVGVAEDLDINYTFCNSIVFGLEEWDGHLAYNYVFAPTKDARQVVELIDREKISVLYVCPETDPDPLEDGPWSASCESLDYACTGSNFIEAALRCFVALKLGEIVDVPDDLLNY